MSDTTRLRALTEAGLLHPHPDGVVAPLFTGGAGFFLPADKVQVKYECCVPVWSTACPFRKPLQHMDIHEQRSIW